MVADFRGIFAVEARARTIYLSTPNADWARRILIGPNLVFEASRSSLVDAPAIGPTGAPPTAPNQVDALGAPVDIALSSTLLGYLASKGSTLLAPAVMRRWSADSSMTWIERGLLVHYPKAGKDAVHVDAHADDVPTATLAVRRLGRATISTAVVVEDAGTSLVYRFRRSATDPSLCPPVSFEVPMLVFEAEIVSMHDGRILARIEEARPIGTPPQMQVDVEGFVPVENEAAVKAFRQYAEAVAHGQWSSSPPSQPYWLRSDVRCKNGEEAFRKLAQQATARAEVEQEAIAAQMFAKTLDPLFSAPAEGDGKGAKVRPKGAAPKAR